MLRPPSLIRSAASLRDQIFKTHVAGGPEEVRPDLTYSNGAMKIQSDLRASRRARLVLRIDSGRRRRSSPSSARMLKA